MYDEASPRASAQYELLETPTGILVKLVKVVVELEGPVHRDEIITRIRSAWGLQQSGSRINTGNTIEIAVNGGQIYRSGGFLYWPGADPPARQECGDIRGAEAH